MTQQLSPRTQRVLVLGPTLALSLWLGGLGFPLLPRVAACVGLGSILILLVARYQRRRAL
jgi:hypothetical protein